MARLQWIGVLLVITGCGSEGGTGTPGGTGGTGGTGAADSSGSGGSTCPMPTAIEVTGAPIPGSKLGLKVDATEGAVAWTVTLGAVNGSGFKGDWSLPSNAAQHVAEPASVTAVVTKPGCNDVTVHAHVVVDWPLADRTLVITNPTAPGSTDVGDYYAAFRGIAGDHLCPVPASDPTVIPGAEYDAWIDAVLGCVAAVGPHVHYLVPVYGVPFRVSGRIDDPNLMSIVDVSTDALAVYGKASKALTQKVFNAYYQPGDSRTGDYQPFVPFGELRKADSNDYFLVARIDGADADAAKALVDRTRAAELLAAHGMLAGTVYVDGNKGLPHPTSDTGYEATEWNIIGVENVFTADGRYPVVANYDPEEFGTAPAPLACPDALYYSGWYSYDHYNDAFTWSPGAIGGHLDSCSACDFRGTQSWSAEALRKGITATFGAVNEPYTSGFPENDQFFVYLLQGATFGEAAYEATKIGGWMMVWIGDPLYRPYPAP